jgi:bifunctional ADP-heptose synthase (sugar kinase/adenylyltransferase)
MRIAVIGDVMLDMYIDVEPKENAEGADVCVAGEFWTYRLGGAGNVLKILSRAGVEVDFYGAVGPDCAGERVCDLASVNLPIARTATTVKLRAVNGNRIYTRIDCDGQMDGPPPIPDPDILEIADAVILSDYNKGMFDPIYSKRFRRIASRLSALSIPLVVDPHPNTPSSLWEGTLVATPNLKEYAQMNEDAGSLYAAVTEGERGATLYGKGIFLQSFACPDPVDDPQRVGAGDAFTSQMAMSLASGEDIFTATKRAVEFANEYVKRPRS